MNTAKLEKETALSRDELDEMFDYLFDLQESGVTNMYGAGEWLEETFDLNPKSSHTKILAFWMDNYKAIKEDFANRKAGLK